MITRTPLLLLLCAAATAVTLPAQAADLSCSKPSDPLYAKGKPHFDQGMRLLHEAAVKGDAALIEQAYSELQSADRICHTPAVIFYLAKAEVGLKRPVEAMRHLREWVRLNGGRPKPAVAGDVKGAKLNEDFNDLWSEAYGVTSHIKVDAPDDAQVLVDGVPLETRAPYADPIDVAPGTREFEARLGNQSKKARGTYRGGEEAHLTLDFDSPSAPPVAANPATNAPATHEQIAAPLEPTEKSGGFGRRPPTVTWILGGTAIVSAAVAVGFSLDEGSTARKVQSLRASSSGSFCADRNSAACAEAQRNIDANSRDKTVAGVLYGAAGACAVGAVVAWALAPRETSSTARAWFTPALSPTEVGVHAGGRF